MDIDLKIFGYYDDPEQTEPAYDPGLTVDCPVCHAKLEQPAVATSLLIPCDLTRSYFYRMHKACADSMTKEQGEEIDGVLIDSLCKDII